MIRAMVVFACLWPLLQAQENGSGAGRMYPAPTVGFPAVSTDVGAGHARPAPASWQVNQDLEKARHFLERQDGPSALAELDAARSRLAEQVALGPGQAAERRREWELAQIERRRWYVRRWVGPVAACYLAALLAGIFWGLRLVQRIDSGRAT